MLSEREIEAILDEEFYVRYDHGKDGKYVILGTEISCIELILETVTRIEGKTSLEFVQVLTSNKSVLMKRPEPIEKVYSAHNVSVTWSDTVLEGLVYQTEWVYGTVPGAIEKEQLR